jgi:hypothetical protein
MGTGLEKADVAWKKKNEFNKCLDKFNKRVPIHNKRFHFSLERQSLPYEGEDEFNKRDPRDEKSCPGGGWHTRLGGTTPRVTRPAKALALWG